MVFDVMRLIIYFNIVCMILIYIFVGFNLPVGNNWLSVHAIVFRPHSGIRGISLMSRRWTICIHGNHLVEECLGLLH